MPATTLLDHARELVVHDQLAEVERHAQFDHPQPIDQVGACQRSQQAGQGLLVTGLRVTSLASAYNPATKLGSR